MRYNYGCHHNTVQLSTNYNESVRSVLVYPGRKPKRKQARQCVGVSISRTVGCAFQCYLLTFTPAVLWYFPNPPILFHSPFGMMNSTIDSVVESELSKAVNGSLDYFITSLQGGNDTLSSFLGHWMSLNDTLQLHQASLKEETLTDAHNLASTISIIASVLLELDTHRDLMEQQLVADISRILNDDMENLVIRDESPISTGTILLYPALLPKSYLAHRFNPSLHQALQSMASSQST
jgi:hypothetical protein